VREALLLHERYNLNAGIDISDGLAIDGSRLAAASGCGAVIFIDRVPIAADAFLLTENEDAPDREAAALQHALSDGQDFELLFATAPDTAREILRAQPLDCPIAHVGELVPQPGLWQQRKTGERTALKPIGWLHS
jgi:thiamine-monophosphate kinase